MFFLKQSTAATVKLGPFLDETDGITAETGLTISQADIRLSKNGGAFAQSNNAAGATHDAAGWYGIPLDTTDTNTVGRLIVAIHESGALPVWAEFMVFPANVFDSLVAGSDYLQVDAVQVEGGDATDGIRDSLVDDATRIDASALNTLSGHDPGETIAGATDLTAAAIADAVLDEALSGHTGAGSLGKAVADIETDATAILADTDELQAELADGGRTDLLIDAILADTAELQTDDIPTLIAALNDLSAADVNSQVADVLTVDVLADSVAADGSRPTMAQAVLMILRFLTEKAVAGTTVTVRKEDGSTACMTFTLDDDAAPTEITRAT